MSTQTTTDRRTSTSRRTAVSATAVIAAAMTIAAAAAPASARPYDGPFPNPAKHPIAAWDTTWAAPAAVSRVGTQVVRCDTGEGNLGGAGRAAPTTLPQVTTCARATGPSSTPAPASAAMAHQLERDLLR